jgi:hypothetical protein
VLAQHGFTRSIDVMSACALAAAIHASAAEIGRIWTATPFTTLHHPDRTQQIFLGELPTARGAHIPSHRIRRATSIGPRRLYFES